MNKEIFDKITALFEAKLGAKTGWGKNDIIALYKDCTNEVVMQALNEMQK